MGWVLFFSLRIPVYKEIQLPNQFSLSLYRSWLPNSLLFPSFFLKREEGAGAKATFASYLRTLPTMTRLVPAFESDPALRCRRQGLAYEALPSNSRPQLAYFLFCSRVFCFLVLLFELLALSAHCHPHSITFTSFRTPPPRLPGKGEVCPWEKRRRGLED